MQELFTIHRMAHSICAEESRYGAFSPMSASQRLRLLVVRDVRSGFWVVHDLTDLLDAPAGGGDFGGPVQRFFARGDFDDRESADDCFGFWKGSVGDGAVGGYDACPLAEQSAAEDPDAGTFGFPDHPSRGLTDLGHILLGDMVHRAVIE